MVAGEENQFGRDQVLFVILLTLGRAEGAHGLLVEHERAFLERGVHPQEQIEIEAVVAQTGDRVDPVDGLVQLVDPVGGGIGFFL